MSLSSFLKSAVSRASSSDASIPRAEPQWDMPEALTLGLTAPGRTSSANSLQTYSPQSALATLPATKQLVAQAALTKLFSGNHFSICTVRDLCDIVGTSHNSDAMRVLHPLHCMDYAAMTPQLKMQLPGLVNEALRPAGRCIATDMALDGVVFDQ